MKLTTTMVFASKVSKWKRPHNIIVNSGSDSVTAHNSTRTTLSDQSVFFYTKKKNYQVRLRDIE